MSRPLPPTASVAEPVDGAKLFAPSAERNARPIADLLAEFAPKSGRALEIASGTGQHVIEFAARLPGLDWYPTDPDASRRASTDAYAAEAGLPNLRPAQPLNAAAPGWSAEWPGQDLIVLCNLLHLIAEAEVITLLREASQALTSGGLLLLYGPFKRGGELTSDGDTRFDAELRAADPAIGYKDDFEMLDQLCRNGLDIASVVEMPANNLAILATRP